MVLESIINPIKAEKKPWELFFIGILYATIGILFSLWVFKQYSSLIMVFLTVIVSIPLTYATMKLEEYKDLGGSSEKFLLKEHSRAIEFLMFLFLGILVSFSLWYVFLPPETVQVLFSSQLETITSINSQVTGKTITSFMSSDIFQNIFLNNIKVLMFCVLFAFFYGAGALFILTWNASVIAAAVGTYIRNNLANYASLIGLSAVWTYFHVFSFGLLRYMTHGVFEIVAYFVGGLAGGIISVAVINHDFRSKRFRSVLFDSLSLIIISLIILILAALVEVFVTPILF